MQTLNHSLSKNSKLICFNHKTVLAFTLCALLILINCGKRKPPLPPVERVQQRAELTGFQRGDKILLTWKMPPRNASDSDLLNIDRADIYRLVEKSDASYSLSEDEFAAKSIIISTESIKPDDFFENKTFIDTLEFAGQSVRLLYAIRFVNKNGQKAAFSNFLVIEPTNSITVAPSNLKGLVTQDEIKLYWDEPKSNIANSAPKNILGYNIYRSQSENEAAKLINKSPVSSNEFNDAFFDFGKTYFYFVRAVSLGNKSEPIESAESNIITISPIDNFVPSAPEAITIAAAPGTISIFFAVNPEKDIAGYQIFRSTDENQPKNDWKQVTTDLLQVNSFQDNNIQSGTKYFYYLKAVDKAGNISEPSITVSETAP